MRGVGRESRVRILWAGLVAAACCCGLGVGSTLVDPPAPSAQPAPPGRFELVGSNPLLGRGMNAALAVHGDYAYVGSRTDGTHPDSGILVVRIADPEHPKVVSQIGPPRRGQPRREPARAARLAGPATCSWS